MRNLGLAAAVVILGGGTLVAVQLLGMGHAPGMAKPDPNRLAVRAALALRAEPPAPTPAPEAAPAVPPAAAPERPADAAPTVAPTPADFARPAFLEPIGPRDVLLSPEADAPRPLEPATADADVDPVEVASIPTPPDGTATPLPRKRPENIPAADADDAAKGRTGRITMDINLRSGPRRSSRVIGTIPEGTKVKVVSCKSWCEVVADDKRGYVYRRAVDR